MKFDDKELDILATTQEALNKCSPETLNTVEKVTDAMSGLFETLAPAQTTKARFILGVLKGCIVEARAKNEDPAPDEPDTGSSQSL